MSTLVRTKLQRIAPVLFVSLSSLINDFITCQLFNIINIDTKFKTTQNNSRVAWNVRIPCASLAMFPLITPVRRVFDTSKMLNKAVYGGAFIILY